ncbi:efflux RND transporter periplasmic adaptor subunit [Polaribacter glomeratus]|uniref:Efflux transporter periplasmic adaptor subunit n=1 Tax=Polaribacter glomeratus TaxID=102 RepID=A0A2S7WGH8_9FLAO|nr:efflux RND transporter periplasmic adaptor subunit [Polaribacter glomeratus]PQJ76362.1 efflux transporter periplasmic adaptor subunit [Polaribacter glomeratus]TXD65497.1 efflux RND transporter periplasmic adaptor subunit [Polaribacter glomeratus]
MKNLYIMLFSFAFLACGNQEKNTNTKTETTVDKSEITITKAQFESEKMEIGQISEQAFNTVIKTNGMIDVPPENKASVSTFVGGYVSKIPLLIGDKVVKGQLIASLTNIEFVEMQQQYLEISEQLAYLKNEYIRQKTLFDEQITSQKNYLRAESAYKSNLATYNGLRQKLQMLNINPTAVDRGQITSTINIYAPISGYITKVNVSNGSFVSSASELLEIVNTNHIHLELSVFEKDILKVKKEQKILFKVSETSNKMYDAEVYLVGTSINNDRTIKVHGHIHEEEKMKFITGMFVEADIICDSKKEISLPKSAIIQDENNYFALILADEKENKYQFKKVKLTIGLQDENYVQVKNYEVLENKKVLTKGVFMLLNNFSEE